LRTGDPLVGCGVGGVVQLADIDRIGGIDPRRQAGDSLTPHVDTRGGHAWAARDGQAAGIERHGRADGHAIGVDAGVASGDAAIVTQVDVLGQLDLQTISAIGHHPDVAIGQLSRGSNRR